MSTTFTKSDLDFLKSVGIGVSAELSFAEERQALAQRIAKHAAPVQVSVAPGAARLELIRLALRRLLEAGESNTAADEPQ